MAMLVVGAFLVTVVLGQGRQRRTAHAWVVVHAQVIKTWRSQPRSVVVSAALWAVLVTCVVGWDLASFIGQSPLVPTLSFYIGRVTRYSIGRGLLFFLWLGLGAYVVAGWRAESPR